MIGDRFGEVLLWIVGMHLFAETKIGQVSNIFDIISKLIRCQENNCIQKKYRD
jgi:hypothetical protein